MRARVLFCTGLFVTICLLFAPASAWAQCNPNCNVGNEAQLTAALASLSGPGDHITLTNNITLTGNLQGISTSVAIDGGGYTLSGNNNYRGLSFGYFGSFGPPLTIDIQNLTIANTLAKGGAGGSGAGGGGGGAGVGGGLFVDDNVLISVSNVALISNAAVGGTGGASIGGSYGGGGGGLTGTGANASTAGGDGGGFLGSTGGLGGAFNGNPGGFGAGGGGSSGGGVGGTAGAAGFGGGGGGGDHGGAGGYGGGGSGGGQAPYFSAGAAGLFGGSGSAATGGGGGGGALGGAMFVSGLSSLQVLGSFTINGASVAGGAGGVGGGGNGASAGDGIFVAGSGGISFVPSAGQNVTINNTIADEFGTLGVGGSVGVGNFGTGTLTLNGNNKFSGSVLAFGGTTSISSDANLGVNNGVVLSDATLAITATNSFNHPVALSGNGVFNVGAGKTASWLAPITDSSPGTLVVAGGGTLSLLNSLNAYTGGTKVSGGSTVAVNADNELGASSGIVVLGDNTSSGTLSINAPSFSSNRNITLGAGGGVIDTVGGTNATLGGTIDGTGGLTKAGTGTLLLTGIVGYAGPTVITGGTIKAGNKNLFLPGASLSVGAGSTIDFGGFSQQLEAVTGSGTLALGGGTLTVGSGGSSSAFGGTISGSGGLVKAGGGTLTLLGANTYAGGTTVGGGTLVANTGSILGPIVNNASLIFDQGSNGTYAGNISGSGAFGKSGAGTLTLTGTNSYTGGTIVSGGTLIGTANNLQGLILDNAAVTLVQDTNATFNGTLAGNGLFSKAGLGTLTVNGAHPFAGTMSVDQGALGLNGLLGGNVNVGTLGTLIASGLISGSATISGNLAIPALAGSSAGLASSRFHTMATSTAPAPQFIVNGDFNALQGSNLTFTVVPNGAPPIYVNGHATLQGANINVTINDPNPARYSTYTALTAVQGLTASGLTVTSNTSIVPVLRAEPNSLLVTLLNYNIPLAGVVTGSNAAGVGKAIDKLRVGATGDLAFISHELTALSDSELSAALKSLSGEVHASQTRIAAADSQSMTDMVRSTISDREESAKEEQTGPSGATHHAKAAAMWLEMAADHATMADGTVANSGGGVGGYDLRQSENFTAGAGLSFTQGTMTLGQGGGVSQMKAPRAFAYTGFKLGPFKLHGGGSAAKTSNSTSRNIAFQATVTNQNGQQVPLTSSSVNRTMRNSAYDTTAPSDASQVGPTDGVNRTAQSDQTGVASDAWTELKLSRNFRGWHFDYKSSGRTSRISRNAFTETGAGAISLESGSQVTTIKEADINMAGAKTTGKWRPNFLLEYRREFAPTSTTADMNFAGHPDAGFETAGIPIPQTEYKGVAGITMHGNWLEYTIQYHYSKLQGEHHQSLSVRVHFR